MAQATSDDRSDTLRALQRAAAGGDPDDTQVFEAVESMGGKSQVDFIEAQHDDEPARAQARPTSRSTGRPASRPSSRTAPRRLSSPASQSNANLKATFAPVLITFGCLMLIPGVWSILHLSGILSSARGDATRMAYLMLMSWPIGLALIGAGVWFFLEAKKHKK
ncbi:MAG: hypothetical protein GC164_10995 [Phycisphaera sp.]|nr:hypothetical protein [Phycisphaera sp.]